MYPVGSLVSSKGLVHKYFGFPGTMTPQDVHQCLVVSQQSSTTKMVTIDPFRAGLIIQEYSYLRLILIGDTTYWMTTYQIE